jgi:hypothetical protein
MAEIPTGGPDVLPLFKNHLAVVVALADLLLGELAETDPRRADLEEIRRSARAALDLIPELSKRLNLEHAAR